MIAALPVGVGRSLTLLIACGLLAAGCGDDPAAAPAPAEETAPPTAGPTADPTAAPTEQPAEPPATEDGETAAACGPEESVAIQGGEHLIGDQEPPVPYSSTPPTSGWHSSGAFEVTVVGDDEALSEPQQVSVLEAGGVVVTHNELDEAARADLEQLVRERYDGRVAVTPYAQLDSGEVAMTAWGVLQRCQGYDEASVTAFIDAHAAEGHVSPGHGDH